ncbi:MAG TPA: hypothetical protein DIT04_05620 [Dysgonomonas sp.]|nr:hypothetical protein [Dysgonomonas sp.]
MQSAKIKDKMSREKSCAVEYRMMPRYVPNNKKNTKLDNKVTFKNIIKSGCDLTPKLSYILSLIR